MRRRRGKAHGAKRAAAARGGHASPGGSGSRGGHGGPGPRGGARGGARGGTRRDDRTMRGNRHRSQLHEHAALRFEPMEFVRAEDAREDAREDAADEIATAASAESAPEANDDGSDDVVLDAGEDLDEDADEDSGSAADGAGVLSGTSDASGESGESGESGSESSLNAEDDLVELVGMSQLDDFGMSDDELADYAEHASDLDDDAMLSLLKNTVGAYEFEPLDTALPPAPLSARKRAKNMAHKLVNSGAYTPPLWDKYPESMALRDVHEEVRAFYEAEHEEVLIFPPFKRAEHERICALCARYRLTVKEKKRKAAEQPRVKYLIVTKSLATYAGGRVPHAPIPRHYQYIPVRRADAAYVPKEGSRARVRAVEGTVIGADAASIGASNFGHRLLQQMGWSAGTGLGKDRSGIVDPLQARVKTSRVGLGTRP